MRRGFVAYEWPKAQQTSTTDQVSRNVSAPSRGRGRAGASIAAVAQEAGRARGQSWTTSRPASAPPAEVSRHLEQSGTVFPLTNGLARSVVAVVNAHLLCFS